MVMKILLLGGNGYAGSALWTGLKDHHLNSIDLCMFGKDLGYSDKIDIADLTQEQIADFDVVILLAAHSSVGLCITAPLGAVKNNIENFVHITNIMKPDQKLIYASSTSVYGQSGTNCTESQTSWAHYNWYDITKKSLDVLAQSLIQKGRPIVGLRFGTICGPSPNTRQDLFLNSMTSSALSNGSLWVNNLSSWRSVLAISDLVSAFDKLINHKFVPGIYNLKSFDTNMGTASQLIANRTGVSIEYREDDASSYNFTVDHQKFCQTFDWEPQMSIESVVAQLIEQLPTVSLSLRTNWPVEGCYAE